MVRKKNNRRCFSHRLHFKTLQTFREDIDFTAGHSHTRKSILTHYRPADNILYETDYDRQTLFTSIKTIKKLYILPGKNSRLKLVLLIKKHVVVCVIKLRGRGHSNYKHRIRKSQQPPNNNKIPIIYKSYMQIIGHFHKAHLTTH